MVRELAILAVIFSVILSLPSIPHKCVGRCSCAARDCTGNCRPDDPTHGCCEPHICECLRNPAR